MKQLVTRYVVKRANGGYKMRERNSWSRDLLKAHIYPTKKGATSAATNPNGYASSSKPRVLPVRVTLMKEGDE